jgi:transcriptional regulator with XRE-family HTH domain
MLLKDAAAASGLSVSYISDVERGRTLPSLGAIERLAAVYGFRAGVHFYEIEATEGGGG